MSPNYAAAYFNRGLAYRRKPDFDHAIADYDQAIRLDPKNASVLNNRGIVWFEKGDFDRAIADYNQAIKLDANFAAGLQQSRRRLARQGRSGARTRRFRPRHPAVAAIRARLRQSRPGLLPEAGLSARHQPISTPRSASIRTNADAFSNRGNAHDDKGDRNAAIADYNEAIRLDPKNARIYYDRGIAFRRDGDLDRAIADLSKAMRAQPAARRRLQ